MSWESDIVLRDVTNAGVVISDRISREAAAQQLDLEEALEAARYSSHPYSTYPKEWPSLVEVADTRELPAVLVERYNTSGGEGTALCGIFPEIRRAWASVDNSLFLWRFDRWDGQCPEYSRDEQAICAVGLVKSRPGVFVEAIKYLLILATPIELILVGVCCSGSDDGSDPYEEVSFQPLPEYVVPSDGITMTCVTSTDKGHIFLAGRDGHIYELEYAVGSIWHKRCRKVCLTTGLGSIISSWVIPNIFKFGTVDPIVEMVVDNERHILYARTAVMKLLVYSLGPKGEGPLKKVAEEKNLCSQRDGHYGGRQSLRARAPNRSAKSSIVCISPMSTSESKYLHLVVVLSDGRRLYLSTASSGNGDGVGSLGPSSGSLHRPSCLKVVTTRSSPPFGASNVLAFGTMSVSVRTQADDMSHKVEAAFYSASTLILSDSSPANVSSLLFITRDSGTQTALSGGLTSSRVSRALREHVSSVPLEGRMLLAADILRLPGTTCIIQSLSSKVQSYGLEDISGLEKSAASIYARGDLAIQHILPRRRVVVFGTMGLMEIVFNRPVDILKKLLEMYSPRSFLEEFFNRFGIEEAAAMCLMLAAKLVDSEDLVSSIVSEKAAEAFEDPRLVGIPQLDRHNALSSTKTVAGGFSMGQVVQDPEPVFSGAHEGLCLCAARLLFPLWEFPVMIVKGTPRPYDVITENAVITCRIDVPSMEVLENKIRSLEKFLRSRKNQRRGLYGCVSGLGDPAGSIAVKNFFGSYCRNVTTIDDQVSNKRQRLSYTPSELASMEVRAMECIRQVLLRSSEALFLLQLLSQHHITRLAQGFDIGLRRSLVELTFNQLVCSVHGDELAASLISSLMDCYTGPDGRGTMADISGRLREGCPSYYKESDYKFYLAVEHLGRASATYDTQEKESLAREAFNALSRIPESVDLRTVCKRFEDLRFYEAVVCLPLQKAQALDPAGDAFNQQIDVVIRERAISQREQCYEIITSALSSLKGATLPMNEVSQKYICQIVQLGVQSPDKLFHEYLYRAMIDLSFENELLEYGGSDLVLFLQRVGLGQEPIQELGNVSAAVSPISDVLQSRARVPLSQVKCFDLLAKYYVLKRQHVLAAHVLLKLTEMRFSDAVDAFTLDQRRQYLSNAVLQAKNASESDSLMDASGVAFDQGLVDLLEAKLSVLHFQIKIHNELEALALRLESSSALPGSGQDEPLAFRSASSSDSSFATNAREKDKELGIDLKNISQLYNEYAVPFELWEVCVEMLYFASLSGDADNSIIRDAWARLLEQALSLGGIAESCAVLKRVGSHVYPGDGAVFPLDNICVLLEKAALERLISGIEPIGDDEIPKALIGACNGAIEPVLNTYDQLLFNAVILPSPDLRLRLLRSVLTILWEWAMSVFGRRMGTGARGASLILHGAYSFEQSAILIQGVRDRIISAINRFMTEVRRLPLPQGQTDVVYQGYRKLEESIISMISLDRF